MRLLMNKKFILLLFCWCYHTSTADEKPSPQQSPTDALAKLLAVLAKPKRPDKETLYRPKGSQEWKPVPNDYILWYDSKKYEYATIIRCRETATKNQPIVQDEKQPQKISILLHYPLITIQIFLSKQIPDTFKRVIA